MTLPTPAARVLAHVPCAALFLLLPTADAQTTVVFNLTTTVPFICAGQSTFQAGDVNLTVSVGGTILSGSTIRLFYGSAVNSGFVVGGTGSGVIQATNPGSELDLTFTANQNYSPGGQITISNVTVVKSGGYAAGQSVIVQVAASPSTAAGFSPVSQEIARAATCSIVISGGNNQTGTVASALASPLVVSATPCIQGINISFAVSSGGGSVSPSQGTTAPCQVSTNWTLGPTAGGQSVMASSAGMTPLTFNATAQAGPAAAIAIANGNNQTGEVGRAIGALSVRSSDQFGNSVAGAQVSFAVTAGGGSVSPAQANTDQLGLASTTLTLGPQPGVNTVRATSTGLTGSPLTFTATAIQPTPSIRSGGIAPFLAATDPNGRVTPGGIVSISGSEFGATAFATALPLPTALGGTSVTFNGIATPLFFVSPGQIYGQLPFDVSTGQATVVVRRGSTPSAPQTVQLAAVSPAIFTVNGAGSGPGAILHAATLQHVTGSNPAHSGEGIIIYCVGLGAVDGAVNPGATSPSPAPQTLTTPKVTIADLPAEVSFSGLAAGYVGIYRVDATVPAAVPPGTQNLQIVMADVPSNTVTIAVQ